jgi:aminoglycoside phosphotransferase (APT) family kinase protein
MARSVARRFAQRFEAILRTDAFWAQLFAADRPMLARVRARCQAHAALLPWLEEELAATPVVLIHGDLAGDNLMVTPEGRLALVDWGATRISAAWVDIASLVTYAEWSPEERRRFYCCYFVERAGSAEEARQCLGTLTCLHRYHACVQSLLWLNDEGEGLDAVGRAFFERQVAAR